MSGAQSWKGIDPKVREAAREAAARQGMSLGEYLNHALTSQSPQAPAPGHTPSSLRPRASRLPSAVSYGEGGEDDWRVTDTARADRSNLAHRIESIERRMQLAVTGLDRAVSTIDRSVLGLSARIDEAEAVSGESAERVSEALEHFRVVGDALSGQLERAERESEESRHAMLSVRERLEAQVAVAEEVARRAEAAASFLASELESRDGAMARTLAEARAAAEEAARQASDVSADAVSELRQLQEQMREGLAEAVASTRRAVETAIQEVRAETSQESRGTREALLEEVVRLESEIAKRVGAAEQLRTEQAALIARIERAEAGARESTAGLRQAAGAAIADLRNAQLTLAARVKQVEEGGGGDLTDLRHAQQDIAERLRTLEVKTEANPVADALAAFEQRIAGVERSGGAPVQVLDQTVQRLASRIAETESSANTAIRTLEETVAALNARVEHNDAAQETEALRALLESRLSQMVDDARLSLAAPLQAALEQGGGLGEQIADVNQRLAAAERRQTQTIEAISLEIRRMSETIDKRLRTVEARNDDAAAAAVREELTRMAASLEKRFDEIESREGAAFDRMSLEVGRLSERLEDRVGAVESRSAQAIEHVGEQVARMAERFNQRQEGLARELGERMLDSEERAGARVSEAISSIMQRLAEVEVQSAEAIAPVQKAVSSVASKLDRYESGRETGELGNADFLPTPTRRTGDINDFHDIDPPEPYVSPAEAAHPLRAGPLPPTPPSSEEFGAHADDDALDIYFNEPAAEAAVPQPSAPTASSFEFHDDLLIEDADERASVEEASLFGAVEEAPPFADIERAAPPPELPPQAPTTRNNYLANARKAAQAQSQPKQRPEQAPSPRLSLRGSSRIVLWGAASAVAALAALGVWYANNQNTNLAGASELAPTPANARPETSAVATPSDSLAAGSGDAEISDGFEADPVVAGPLTPRNVSLEQAAQAGDVTAQYELALQRLGEGRAQEGVTLLRRAADRGLAMAQYRLAKLYERGEGVTADLAVARQWTERAAAGGNRRAMHDLGVYFARGEGAPLDEAAAFRWFRQAAELGVADSQYNLGILYQQGRGVNASPSEALFWFLVAARHGDTDANARATALETQLPANQTEQAQARAQAFRPRAASAVANGEFSQRPATRSGT